MAERRPNFLILMSDQHRADVLGCAGNPVVETPQLDRLAAEGVRFDRAYCQGPLCMPARASFLTERYVRDHGVYQNNWDTPETLPTFLQSLQGAGYRTSCIGKMHLYRHGARRARDTREAVDYMRLLGFDEPIETVGKLAGATMRSEYSDFLEGEGLLDRYREHIAAHGYGPAGTVTVNGAAVERKPPWHAESTPLPAHAFPDAWIGRRVVRWIEEYDRNQPWCQWVGFPGPHDPWDAPREYVDRYRDAEIPLPNTRRPEVPDGGPLAAFLNQWLRFSASDTLTDERIREVRRHYYANVTLIDEQIGAIVDALRRTGMLENTWIVYTTDHGEMNGEHGLLMKMVFYEPSVRVPLIVRPPAGMGGRAERGLVQHIDVPATLRDLAGAPDLPGSDAVSLRGHFEPGGRGAARDAVYSENYGFGMVRTERHKLVFAEDAKEPVQLFDLEADPLEDRNLIDDPEAAAVRERLVEAYMLPFLRTPPLRPGPGLLDGATRRR